jgi:hypothetical protein
LLAERVEQVERPADEDKGRMPSRKEGKDKGRKEGGIPPLGGKGAAQSALSPPSAESAKEPLPSGAEQQVRFDEDGRLGFEVIWSDPPSVGVVHDGQQASRCGVLSGDVIVACDGQAAQSCSRGEILEILKRRPLTLTIGRNLEGTALVAPSTSTGQPLLQEGDPGSQPAMLE